MALAEQVAKQQDKASTSTTSSSARARAGKGGAGAENKETSLYAEYQKVYPKKVSGFFRSIKTWTAVVLLGVYFLGPWLRWDRGPNAPDQAILLDMAGRRGYIFGIEIWPQEVYYLTGLLILGAVGLFLATALFGRVWCGFTCIQTVFTDLFVMVERWFEGDRNARIKFDRGPWTLNKIGRKAGKNVVWLAIAFLTGWTWVIYFNDAPATTMALLSGEPPLGVLGFALLVTGSTYLLAGFAREQVCIYMCPWPRFQGAMFDEDSLIVTYEKWRGEPRGFAKKGESFENRGHCVDCRMCVQVCPTGIDIRNGTQLACIGCGLCIDACNSIMDRFGLPRDLITYDSVSNQVARAKGQPTKFRFVRPRTVIYAAILVLVAGVMAFSLATRSRLEINVLHERSPLFVPLSDGDIRNGYTLKILNMQPTEQTFTLRTENIEGATLEVVGYTEDEVTSVNLPVKADSVGTFRVYVTADPAVLEDEATDMDFILTNVQTGEQVEYETLFAGPDR